MTTSSIPLPPRLPPAASRTASSRINQPSINISASTNASYEQQLGTLLSAPSFTTSSYLNQALANIHTKSKETQSSHLTTPKAQDEEEQRLMAELALNLQVQTQSCHDEIGRIGAELKAILPRCAADLSRLNVGIGNIQDDAKNLLEAHLQSSLSHVPNAEVFPSEGAGREDGEESNPDHDEKENQDPPDHGKGMEEDNEAMTPLETLETLSTLHALQQNLTKTKKVLTAASTYNHTLQKIPSLLTPTTLNQGVQALLDLENGARALTGLPGNRREMMRLERFGIRFCHFCNRSYCMHCIERRAVWGPCRLV
jgi:hypothetical protein